MKNHKNPLLSLLSVIAKIFKLITRPVYLAVAITLITLFPAKKLKLTAPIQPSNVEHSQKDAFVSTQDIMVRTRMILGLNLDPKANIWIDKMEYLEELEHLDFLEGYDFALSAENPRHDLDYDRMEEWYLQEQIKSINEENAKIQKELSSEIEFLSAYISTLRYCSLEYWPYDFC